MNLIADQMAALNDYTRESFASRADDVISSADEQLLDEMNSEAWNEAHNDWLSSKDEC